MKTGDGFRPSGKQKITCTRDGNRVILQFEYAPSLVAAVKTIPGRRYDPDTKTWNIPDDELDAFQLKMPHIEFVGARMGPMTLEDRIVALGDRSLVAGDSPEAIADAFRAAADRFDPRPPF